MKGVRYHNELKDQRLLTKRQNRAIKIDEAQAQQLENCPEVKEGTIAGLSPIVRFALGQWLEWRDRPSKSFSEVRKTLFDLSPSQLLELIVDCARLLNSSLHSEKEVKQVDTDQEK